VHRLPYLKTNCSGSFEVMNNSLSKATLRLARPGAPVELLETSNGAVLEMRVNPVEMEISGSWGPEQIQEQPRRTRRNHEGSFSKSFVQR